MAEPDTAKEVRPVVMFDDRERMQGQDVRDFRPISEHVERTRQRGSHLGGLEGLAEKQGVSNEPLPEGTIDAQRVATGDITPPASTDGEGDPDEPVAPPADPDLVPDPDDDQTTGQPDESPEDDPGIAPPEVDEPENAPSPPAAAPEPEPATEDDGGEDPDDIPSPWDEPTSD